MPLWVELRPAKKDYVQGPTPSSPLPVNGALFGHNVFADVQVKPTEFGWALNPKNRCPSEKREIWMDTDTQRGGGYVRCRQKLE